MRASAEEPKKLNAVPTQTPVAKHWDFSLFRIMAFRLGLIAVFGLIASGFVYLLGRTGGVLVFVALIFLLVRLNGGRRL
jgi:hypothetical protein